VKSAVALSLGFIPSLIRVFRVHPWLLFAFDFAGNWQLATGDWLLFSGFP
jgi:hypothetical protein